MRLIVEEQEVVELWLPPKEELNARRPYAGDRFFQLDIPGSSCKSNGVHAAR